MNPFYDVKLLSSAKGKHPIAQLKVNDNKSYTFNYAGCGRKDKDLLYYSCIQCKRVDKLTRGCKQIHLKGTAIVNGNPMVGHKVGCDPAKSAVVHAEEYKRKASREVREGIASVGTANLHNRSLMAATAEEAGVDVNESRLSWDTKAMGSRLNKNKTARVPPMTSTGDLPDLLKVYIIIGICYYYYVCLANH
jgi:hypothetical protein